MSKELVIETGKCKMRAYAYPVRIYATDAGVCGTHVHGAYQDAIGWQSCTWDKHGRPLIIRNVVVPCRNLNTHNLVHMPVTKYFNIWTSFYGRTATGLLYDTVEEAKSAWGHALDAQSADLFSYSEGVVKKVDSLC